MHLVARLAAGGTHRARHQHRPHLDVAARIADHCRLARGAARGVHAQDFAHRHGEHAERIILAQIFLGGERKFGEIVEAFHVARPNSRRRELLLVVRHARGARQRLLEPRKLQRAQLVKAGILNRVRPAERPRAQILVAHGNSSQPFRRLFATVYGVSESPAIRRALAEDFGFSDGGPRRLVTNATQTSLSTDGQQMRADTSWRHAKPGKR